MVSSLWAGEACAGWPGDYKNTGRALRGGHSRMSFTRTLIRIGVQSVDSLAWLAMPWGASCGYHRGRRPSQHICHSNENPDLGIVLGALFKVFD